MMNSKNMPDELFEKLIDAVKVDKNCLLIDEYGISDVYTYSFSDKQIDTLLDIINDESWLDVSKEKKSEKKQALDIAASQYLNLVRVILLMENEKYLTTERLILVMDNYKNIIKRFDLNYYGENNTNFVSAPIPSTKVYGEPYSTERDIIELFSSKKLLKDRDILEKYIDDNIELFLCNFGISPVFSDMFNIPKYKVFDEKLQTKFPFSKEFLEKHYKYFLIMHIVDNKYIKDDIELQRIVFKEILENSFNMIAEVKTYGKVKAPFKVSDDMVLASIVKYNL